MRLITSPLFAVVAFILCLCGALAGAVIGLACCLLLTLENTLASLVGAFVGFARDVRRNFVFGLEVMGAWIIFGWDTAELIFKRPNRVYRGWF